MMKQNVDLTKNQMFSHPQFDERRIHILSNDTEFPWIYPFQKINEHFEAIRTGNRDERELKKLCEKVVSRHYCDRCGVFLKNIPWSRTYCLCKKCSDELAIEIESFSIYPWDNLNVMQQNDDRISLAW